MNFYSIDVIAQIQIIIPSQTSLLCTKLGHTKSSPHTRQIIQDLGGGGRVVMFGRFGSKRQTNPRGKSE